MLCRYRMPSGMPRVLADRVSPEPVPDPNTCPPAECGRVSPLIPMQSAEAVHMGLVWKNNSQNPKILFHSRLPEFTPNDMADAGLTDLAIKLGAFSTPGLQFNSSLRDVLHGFGPFLALKWIASRTIRSSGSPAAATRCGRARAIAADRTMERQLLFDTNHPRAFANSGKFHTALLDERDFAMNRAAFAENGYSKGMLSQSRFSRKLFAMMQEATKQTDVARSSPRPPAPNFRRRGS